MYIFFEGISPNDSLWFPLVRRLRPSMYFEDFMMFIYGFFLFLFLCLMDYVYKNVFTCLCS
jgi:hypothetical protein